MVTKTELCAFSEQKIYPGRGRRFAGKDGKQHNFFSNKVRKLYHQRIKPVKLTWTLAWRRFNKKIKIDELQKRRTKRTTRIQKAIVGLSLDDIKRRKAETKEDRDKKIDAAAKEVKERKVKQMQAKKADKAKQTKATNVQKPVKSAPAAKGGKRK
uniref:Large ribosomal subunit protein eL24-related N-terminal domain-containing protein n=1 Tax=Strombidinopsis acuminata TaxID=141414 RepID=A0A7S3SBK2_9SPIT|mmetsp:Transcript_2558/g.3185  ORF Transcript_2558/g.3185 Transcript_2558/m.3185 type:complete len:155 (+) Transcript_2558:94-558(+)|eukprot:CAMPEP_0176339968 /NCGR_PEP_ID=MMETSP0126-20121128/1182_1 /TAXON_ID=141414 ORGANISM="Strombidinopsis acuminatum, Strain SPMC142" /NCGR_SAMPLE_ID=MMETSP0126 /ASSEMBLY_ACC=CAM_ASM_000229 /LENGTH=154 /DNA_ID=CAMNT_0017683863 /DNA_START=70 /DNA_END=534 /DNA_ORIENTATION=+